MSDSESSLPAMSAEEDAYFASGGESPISEAGSDNAGETTGSEVADGGTNSADQTTKPTEKAPQHVPLAALQEERGKRKALGDQVKALEQQIAEFRGKFSVIDRLGKPETADAPARPPTPEEDIFGAVKHVGETVAQVQKRLDDEAKARADADKQSAEMQSFRQNYQADAAAFESKNADYREAYSHLLKTRATELMAIGYDDPQALQAAGASPQEVHAAAKALHDAIVADEMAIAQLAFSKGKSPAEIIYGLAKQRGYAAKAQAEGADAAERLANIERGQNANKSLNSAGSPAGEQDMTAERLLAMPIDEFEAWVDKNPAKARRIMGG